MDFFQECYEYFDESTKAQVSTSQSAEWLLDNFYVVEQAVRQIEEDLPADLLSAPAQNAGWLGAHLPRCPGKHAQRGDASRSRSDQELPANISGGDPAQHRRTLGIAVACCDWQCWSPWPRRWPRSPGADGISVSQPDIWEGIDVVALLRPDPDPNVIVANSILNLRLLGTQDWKAFFEATSILEKTLRSDPAGLYAQMDFETRNRYRSVVEELANGSAMDEAGIARQAIQLAQAAEAAASTREKHVGYYLIAEGRETLEARINFRPRFPRR